jgi:hypothetical protein
MHSKTRLLNCISGDSKFVCIHLLICATVRGQFADSMWNMVNKTHSSFGNDGFKSRGMNAIESFMQ